MIQMRRVKFPKKEELKQILIFVMLAEYISKKVSSRLEQIKS